MWFQLRLGQRETGTRCKGEKEVVLFYMQRETDADVLADIGPADQWHLQVPIPTPTPDIETTASHGLLLGPPWSLQLDEPNFPVPSNLTFHASALVDLPASPSNPCPSVSPTIVQGFAHQQLAYSVAHRLGLLP